MYDESSQDREAALKVTIFASISLAIMSVDFLWLMRDEFKYVWPRLWSAWTPWIYIFTRYLGLASQIFNLYFTVRMYLGVYTSSEGCRLWFIFQAIVVVFLLFSVEGLLMHRIYALFLRNRLILLILVLFIVGQMVSMCISVQLSIPTNEFTSTCLMVRSNPGGAFFSATTMATNMVIFLMTFWKYLRLPAKWTRHGLGRIVFRDSALTLGAISAVMLFLTLCSLDVIKPCASGHSTYYWLVDILWVSIGRIIVNHEKMQRHTDEVLDGETCKGTLQITSQIEMGQNTLTAETESTKRRASTGRTLSRALSSSASTSKVSQLVLSSDCTSDAGHMWIGNLPTDRWRRLARVSSAKPVLFLDIPVSRESELSPWSDSTSDICWEWIEDGICEVGEETSTAGTSEVELSGVCMDDDVLREQDITDMERDGEPLSQLDVS